MYKLRTKSGAVSGFYPNGLPTGKKRIINERNGKLEPVFILKEILLQSDGCIIFDTEEEAVNYWNYIIRECEEQRTRWETALVGSFDKVMEVINEIKVVQIREIKE